MDLSLCVLWLYGSRNDGCDARSDHNFVKDHHENFATNE
jgi:hypothetical protein